MRKFFLLIYYGFSAFVPIHPMPGYMVGYFLRRKIANKLFAFCGDNIVVKNECYFGDGSRLLVDSRSQLGQNARLNGRIIIGKDVLMGPDVIMMATSHAYEDANKNINLQGEAIEKPIYIGDDVWIGTRVVILPGVTIGSHSIIGAGSIVTKSFPEFSIIAGNPAKLIRSRVK